MSNFSVLDVAGAQVRNFPGFGKQQPRGENWLKPELLKEVQAYQAEVEQRKQRLQQLYNEMLGLKQAENERDNKLMN